MMPSKNNLSATVMNNIATGAITDQGVRGLADTLHISERHLRRIVQAQTGSSPLRLDTSKRISAAQTLVAQTTLPIIDIAFMTEFSSLRQFNAVFKLAYKTSPSKMRKTIRRTPSKRPARFITLPLGHLIHLSVPQNTPIPKHNNQT